MATNLIDRVNTASAINLQQQNMFDSPLLDPMSPPVIDSGGFNGFYNIDLFSRQNCMPITAQNERMNQPSRCD